MRNGLDDQSKKIQAVILRKLHSPTAIRHCLMLIKQSIERLQQEQARPGWWQGVSFQIRFNNIRQM